MAKYRHRIFEMYEFRDEAVHGLRPRTSQPAAETREFRPPAFRQLTLSRSDSAMIVEFQQEEICGEETARDLEKDFTQLADDLPQNSSVVIDFTGVQSVCPASIDALVGLRQRLIIKGSRMALCHLDAPARKSFFPAASS